MTYLASLIISSLFSFNSIEHDSTTIKGIVITRDGTTIPYCDVSIKGTTFSVITNQCGEFELSTDKNEFTIVFNCSSTHDFITFEKILRREEMYNGQLFLFELKKHTKLKNKVCKKAINKGAKKIVVQ